MTSSDTVFQVRNSLSIPFLTPDHFISPASPLFTLDERSAPPFLFVDQFTLTMVDVLLYFDLLVTSAEIKPFPNEVSIFMCSRLHSLVWNLAFSNHGESGPPPLLLWASSLTILPLLCNWTFLFHSGDAPFMPLTGHFPLLFHY